MELTNETNEKGCERENPSSPQSKGVFLRTHNIITPSSVQEPQQPKKQRFTTQKHSEILQLANAINLRSRQDEVSQTLG
jgi:hypothetical protein